MTEREEALYQRVYDARFKAALGEYAERVREAHDAAMKAVRDLRNHD